MKLIFKYPVETQDYFFIKMPVGAKILDVQVQHGRPQIWALVDPAKQIELRSFRLAGTGHPIDDQEMKHIGTFQIEGGVLVFHLFEIEKPKS